MAQFININGHFVPAGTDGIRGDNRAFRYGYGLFETMLVQDVKVRLADYHWERLKQGMDTLRILYHPHFFAELAEGLAKTVRKNGLEKLARVRLQVWPSSGGLYDGDPFTAQYFIEAFSIDEEILRLNSNGLVVGIAQGMQKNPDTLSHLKSCNALAYAMAARQAKEAGWNDALLLNHRGNIVESSIANLFWVKGETIYTPPLSEGCVAGVMRGHILRTFPLLGFEVAEKEAAPHVVKEANAAFLSNAIRTIRWIGEINGVALPCGPGVRLHEKLLSSF